MNVLTKREHFTNSRATNFYYSFMFLPPEKREAIEAVYAFARHGDDVADGDLCHDDVRRGIERYRETLDACYAQYPLTSDGRPRFEKQPSLQALCEAIRRYKIPRQYFEELILGLDMDMRMDLGELRYETFEDLALYCSRVAGAVGLIAIEIFGYRNPQTKEYALNMGQALQLVNILRDIQSDARRGRVYLPQEDLDQFGIRPGALTEGGYTSSFVELMQFEGDRARRAFDAARRYLAAEDRRAMIVAEIMGAIYWRLLKAIQARAYNVFGERVRLSRPEKLWTALSVYLGAEWHK
jgi:phytoene synthase